MQLVVYEANGKVQQFISQAEVLLDELAKKYEEAGLSTFVVDDEAQRHNVYVVEQALVSRPVPEIPYDKSEIAANGTEAVHFKCPASSLFIALGDRILWKSDEPMSEFQFSTKYPGNYVVHFTPEWPYLEMSIPVRAT